MSKSSQKAPAWLRTLGLDWYEYQCGRGVHIKMETAQTLGREAEAAGIGLSVHAPYYINLANPDEASLHKNVRYITESCMAAQWMGAQRIVIHPGSLMGRTRHQAMDTAIQSLAHIMTVYDENGYDGIILCLETMGKVNQLGTLDEVLELCSLDERLLPCIDFGHLYARTFGRTDGHAEYVAILDRMAECLGEKRASVFHSHFSHIEYTAGGGEKRHLTFADGRYGPDWAPLAEEVVRRNWSPVFVCESAGTQSEDALEMQRIYRNFSNG